MQLVNVIFLLLTTTLLLSMTNFSHEKLMATERIRPDTILQINVPNTGYVDRVIPYSKNQGGLFIIASGPNQIHTVDPSNNVESFLLDIALNSKWVSMGVVERCVGGLFTPQYSSLNLVYSGDELGKSFIIQVNLKNLTQIQQVISLGVNSEVIDVFENHELGSMHILAKKGQSLSLFTFDPKDNSLREQGYPLMSFGKLNFNREIGLIVGIGNSTHSHILVLDPKSLKIISGTDIGYRNLFAIQSLSSNSLYINIVFSTVNTIIETFAYNPVTKVVEPYTEAGFPTFKRFSKCERFQKAIVCVNNNREMVTEHWGDSFETIYYQLDSSENDLTLSFKQIDDEGQTLLYVPQTYVNDDQTFRISVFNYNKFQ